MTQRFLVPEDLYRLRWVNDPQISPDGQIIAYVLKTIDRETNAYRSAIWMTPAADSSGSAHQFTSDGSQPRWSPDGQWLAFASERAGVMPPPEKDEDPAARDKRLGKGKSQIWVIPATGGEARQLTFMRYGVSDPLWAPDGQKILFSAKIGDVFEPPEHDGKREPRSHRIKEIMYRFNQANYIYEQRTHLFTIPATGGDVHQVTDGDWNDGDAAWSPDSQQIAFSSDRHEERWRVPFSELWLTRADGSDTRCLVSDPNTFFSNPAWSPDGTRIACLGEQAWKAGGQTDVYVFAPGEMPRCITERHFASFSDAIGSDQRSEHADPTPRWSSDGETLFVIGNARGAGNVYALRASDGEMSEVTSGNHSMLGFTLDRSQNAVALAMTDASQPGDIFIHSRDGGKTTRLTEINAGLLGEAQLSTPEEFEFTGADGWTIEGWILKPTIFDPSQKYPMVLEIHGGPNTAYGYTFNLEFQILAGRGFVVLYTNPRGSTSYGRDFGKAVHGAWGEGDYQDLMCGVDALLARGYVDPQRLGVTGGSYGGFMTNWVIGHTDRFKAAVTQRSICNLLSKFGTSDIGPWMALDNWDGAPWEQYDRYVWHSPITYVQNMHTPLLIIHSDRDWRCPIEQAEQLFTALKWLRQEVEMLRFENENHELSRSGHPRLRVERLTAIADWMTDHLTTRTDGSNGHGERHTDAFKEEEVVGAPSPVTEN